MSGISNDVSSSAAGIALPAQSTAPINSEVKTEATVIKVSSLDNNPAQPTSFKRMAANAKIPQEREALIDELTTSFSVTRKRPITLQSFNDLIHTLDSDHAAAAPQAPTLTQVNLVGDVDSVQDTDAPQEQRQSFGKKLMAVAKRGSAAVMAFFNSLVREVSHFSSVTARAIAGYFSSNNMQATINELPTKTAGTAPAKTSSPDNIVKEMLLTSGKSASEHLDNIISEVESGIENKDGLSADDIQGFLREGVGSKANIRMVVTGLSAFNLKQATSMLRMVKNEEFVRKFQADHTPLTAFGDVVNDLLERPLFSTNNTAISNKLTLNTCGTSGDASFAVLLRTAQESGFSVTEKEIGEAFLSRLEAVRSALDEHLPKVNQYLAD